MLIFICFTVLFLLKQSVSFLKETEMAYRIHKFPSEFYDKKPVLYAYTTLGLAKKQYIVWFDSLNNKITFMDYFSRKLFSPSVKEISIIFDPPLDPMDEIEAFFKRESKNSLLFYSKFCISILKTDELAIKKVFFSQEPIQKVIDAENGMFILSGRRYIHFLNESNNGKKTEIINNEDRQFLDKLVQGDEIMDMAYDSFNKDLYFVLGTKIIGLDCRNLTNARLWRVMEHPNPCLLHNIIVTSIKNERKNIFGIITVCQNHLLMCSWKFPNISKIDNRNKIENVPYKEQSLVAPGIIASKPLSFTYILEKEFIVFLHGGSEAITTSYTLVNIFACKYDLEICYTFNYNNLLFDRKYDIFGDIDETDLFYIFDQDDMSTMKRFSLFSNPNFAGCSKNLVFHPQMLGCSSFCNPSKYYYNFPFCSNICSNQQLCSSCDGINLNSCLNGSCRNQYNQIIQNDIIMCQPLESAKCPLSKYPVSNTACQLCQVACESCSGPGSCLSCSGTNKIIRLYDFMCVGTCPSSNILSGTNCYRPEITNDDCWVGYYFNLIQKNCLKCSIYCQKCIDSQKCSTCFPGYNLLNDFCIDSFCFKGYYLALDEINNAPICLQCNFNCLECVDQSDRCVSCQHNNCLFASKNICIEDTRQGIRVQILDLFSEVCYKMCDTEEKPAYDTSSDSCFKTCPSDRRISVDSQLSMVLCLDCLPPENVNGCKYCPAGTYFNYSSLVCSYCSLNCLECIDVNTCSICEEGFYMNSKLENYKCIKICKTGEYLKQDQTCALCQSNCDSCTNDSSCSKCANGYLVAYEELSNPACIQTCPDNQYEDALKTACLPCPHKCRTCADNTKCSTCNPDNFLHEGRCITNCPDYYFEDVDKCQNCPQSCKICEAINKCLTCQTGYVLDIKGLCRAGCSSNEYETTKSDLIKYCAACDSLCKTCFGKANACTSCEQNKILLENQCLDACPDSFYKDLFNKCLNCDASCRKCENDPSYCLECSETYLRIINSKRCVNSCPSSYYLFTDVCVKCPENCVNCIENICTECDENFSLTESKDCVTKCHTDQFINSKHICTNCSLGCASCSNLEKCSQCKNGYVLNLNSSSCEKECAKGQYWIKSNDTCSNCMIDCEECKFYSWNCSKCKTSFFFLNFDIAGICIDCPSNCEICNSTTKCQKCKDPYVITQFSNCSLKCDESYFVETTKDGHICTHCSENCISCLDSTQCEQCAENYILNQITKTCIKCSNNNANCLGCNSNEYQYNNSCVNECPKNYFKNNETQVCTLCNNSQTNFSVCMNSCLEKEYYNSINLTCSSCHENCSNCFGPEARNCLNCKSGMILKGSECVLIQTTTDDPEKEKLYVSLRKSKTNYEQFYITFSSEVFLPNYFNLDAMISLNVKNAPNNSYTYNVTRTEQNDEFLVTMNFQESCLEPIVEMNITEMAKSYILSQFNSNVTIQTLNETSKFLNISMGSVIVSTSSKEEIETNKKVTSSTFESLGGAMIIMIALCYFMNTKRMSFFWHFCDSMQIISFFLFCQYNYTTIFSSFFEKVFLYHASFIVFIGKKIDTTGNIFYFGKIITDANYDNTNFYKYLGTSSFMVNGFQALTFIFLFIMITLFFKLFLYAYDRYFSSIDDDENLFIGSIRYIDENCMISLVGRMSAFFFNIVMLSAFIQFYHFSTKNNFDSVSLFFGVVGLIYYLVYFIYISRAYINNAEIYKDEEYLYRYDCFFNGLESEIYYKRNYFLFIHLKKFLIILTLISMIYSPKSYLIFLAMIETGFMLYFLLLRPFKFISLNIINFLTELFMLVMTCIFFKINTINSDQKGAITSESVEEIEKITDVLISLIFVIQGM